MSKKKRRKHNGHRDATFRTERIQPHELFPAGASNNNRSFSQKEKKMKVEESRNLLLAGRKRPLVAVSFCFPKNGNGSQNGASYTFGSGHLAFPRQSKLGGKETEKEQRDSVHQHKDLETIEDILSGTKHSLSTRDATQSPAQMNGHHHDTHGDESDVEKEDVVESDTVSAAEFLSGVTVQEAVRDKVGCRPRANSTDGELNLPQRGLCDERVVLRNYKWHSQNNRPPSGLHNLGNTCFLNSTVQCLAHVPPFCQSLAAMHDLVGGSAKGKNPGRKITAVLCRLFRLFQNETNGYSETVSPRALVKALPLLSAGSRRNGYKFRPGRQEDAHELLVHLLDAMNEGELLHSGIDQQKSGWRDRLPLPRLDETTFVHRIFGGYLRSQVECADCGYCSNTYDPFLDLSLEVSKPSCQSLTTAFQEYTHKERLDSKNRWKCSGCKKHVRAQKQLTVFRPPLVLCIQLKRFTYGGFGGFQYSDRGGQKITKPVQFQAQMNLSLSDSRSCAYSLCGIVIHVGGSASSGHYTSCVKKRDKWYLVDDSYVEAINEKRVLQQKNAYLLFYSRREVSVEFPAPPLKAATGSSKNGTSIERSAVDTANELRNGKTQRRPLEKQLLDPATHSRSEPRASSENASIDSARDNQRSESSSLKPESASSRLGKITSSSSSLSSSDGESGSSASGNDSEDSTRAIVSRSVAPANGHPLRKPDELLSAQKGTMNNNVINSEAKRPSKSPTKIVLNRGSREGKLEVMLGPRKHKPWKPKASYRPTGDEFQLLGNLSVDTWNDEAQGSDGLRQNRSAAIGELRKEESSRKRKMHLDRYNAVLDIGKTKKVKKKLESDNSPTPSGNKFQRIQADLERMHRGRPKGIGHKERAKPKHKHRRRSH